MKGSLKEPFAPNPIEIIQKADCILSMKGWGNKNRLKALQSDAV